MSLLVGELPGDWKADIKVTKQLQGQPFFQINI